MNNQSWDVLKILAQQSFSNQRDMAAAAGLSLGSVNHALKILIDEKMIDEQMQLTAEAKKILKARSPRRGIILAAGFGMRMVPINTETPKALLKVNGETLIERLIKQLHEAGIRDITVVVGFMKERLEFLIDQYQVKLVVNPEYAVKNNYYSLYLVRDQLENAYVIPCDLWLKNNIFDSIETYSWYAVSTASDPDSEVRINRKNELVMADKNCSGNKMIGIAYILKETAKLIKQNLEAVNNDLKSRNAFWEEAAFDKKKMILSAKELPESAVTEINTYEQLRELDRHSDQLKSEALQFISKSLNVPQQDITDITILKKGMTNRSFIFSVNQEKYIMRIPGEGTDQLINRKQEAEVYRQINGLAICDDIAAIDPESGYKITKYLESARVCDPENTDDLKKCMQKLKAFHDLKLKVSHEFDIFGQIDFYQSLRPASGSVYSDYDITKANVLKLRPYINAHIDSKCLTHIDAVPDNFLFTDKGLRLIDWEYAGMQDPHVDIAMFCIYALYDRPAVDRLIDLYFDGQCSPATRIKIYCYIAACGLLWSNWCEYKLALGIDFGEYSLRQYRYAKEYYRIAVAEMEKGSEKNA